MMHSCAGMRMRHAIFSAEAAGDSGVMLMAANTPGKTIGGTIALSLKGWTFAVNRDFLSAAISGASCYLPIGGCS
jgi:hypothetical protein